ncbi:hypothetical protein JQS43_20360 [Natronosporangium hydrolyticum]|uniref:Uncharacterized protein n=1 Tax=Natronosporangium hydrolyticum TaxID=2811111 RepID=A0A895YIC2_9ACTN|nr:hypothetical protein [Natronosporangium hydrolyticum]QSB13880.1 hypothetical protein JQS43_20360 [Natronosporangium hydrolyticum]
MTTPDRLALIDTLLTRPFPEDPSREGYHTSGPGHHLHALQASPDFWADRSEEMLAAAESEIEAEHAALVAELTARWGGPEQVALDPVAVSDVPTPEPVAQLAQLSGEMLVWRPDLADRWVGLAVGQGDPELPIVLFAAVGVDDLPVAAPVPAAA